MDFMKTFKGILLAALTLLGIQACERDESFGGEGGIITPPPEQEPAGDEELPEAGDDL